MNASPTRSSAQSVIAVQASSGPLSQRSTAGEPVELGDQPVAGDGPFDQTAQAFAGVLVDDGDDLDRPPVGGGVELEIHRPHPVRRVRRRGVRCGRGTHPLPPAALWDPEPLVAPQPLHLLVVDVPALAAGVVVSPPVPPSGVASGVVPQPLPQAGIWVGRCAVSWLLTLRGPVLPGHSAGEPLTHTHHIDEMVHGRPPACRAQKFPEAISFNAAFSSSASASSRFNVLFSRSRSFSLLASSAFNPPNWFRHR